MFTPPPSPLPTIDDPLAAVVTTPEKGNPAEPRRRLSRRQRLIGLVVPVVILVLISLTSRHVVDGSLDTNPSTAPAAHWAKRLGKHHVPRQLASTDPADQVPTPTATTSAPDTTAPQQLGAGTASTAVPAIPSPPWPVPTPFPQPFDSSLGFNFSTSTCTSFFSDFTTNITFRACRPFSLLIGTSTAFFDIQSNLTELTATMAGMCATPQSLDQCRSTMDWLATEIVKPAACATEITNQNSAVLQALNGFKTYDLMRQAGCLVNQRSNAYCFVESVASPSPVDTYFYTLPLGTPIPQKSTPSCSACTKSLMSLFAEYATDSTLPLSKVYSSAQKMSSTACGAEYAQSVTTSSASPRAVTAWLLLGGTLGVLIGVL